MMCAVRYAVYLSPLHVPVQVQLPNVYDHIIF